MKPELQELAEVAKRHFQNQPKPEVVKPPKPPTKSQKSGVFHHTNLETLPKTGTQKDGLIYIGRNPRRTKKGIYWTELWITEKQQAERREKAKRFKRAPSYGVITRIEAKIKALQSGDLIEVPEHQNLTIWRKAVKRYIESNNDKKIVWSIKKLVI